MYEIQLNFEDKWVLYEKGDQACDAVAWFADKEDAEFARDAFERRAAGGAFRAQAG